AWWRPPRSSAAPPCPLSRTFKLRQYRRHAPVLDLERFQRRAACVAHRTESLLLERSGQRAEPQGAESVAVRLERMRDATKALCVVRCKCGAKVLEHPGSFAQKCVHELAHEVRSGGRLEVFESGAIDGGIGHVSDSRVRSPGLAPPPAGRRGSAWWGYR